MLGYFAVLNPEYIHDIKVQFAAARGVTQPVAAGMSPAACAISDDIVVFSHETHNPIFEVRHGDKGLFEESNETGLALRGDIVVLYIVIPHDLIQGAQIVIDKNSVDQSFHDFFISFSQLQISPLFYVCHENTPPVSPSGFLRLFQSSQDFIGSNGKIQIPFADRIVDSRRGNKGALFPFYPDRIERPVAYFLVVGHNGDSHRAPVEIADSGLSRFFRADSRK
jgi:hypothetical protein